MPRVIITQYSSDMVRSLIERLNRKGKTIILVTHDPAQADRLGDRVMTIDNGKPAIDAETVS